MSDGATARAATASAPRPRIGRNAWIAVTLALTFAVGAVAPTQYAGDFVLRLANEGLLLGLLALSVAFLMSQAGLVALGAASVYGGVGYLFAIGMSAADLSPLAALISALAVATLYSTLLGALIVRTHSLAFMMLTLAAGEMVSHGVIIESLRDYTSGADGLVVAFKGTLWGLTSADYANAARFWPIAWTTVWIVGLTVAAVRRSYFGFVLRATGANEERMRFSGFNTYLPRVAGYVFANTIAAICGLLHVLNSGFVSPESLSLSVSTNALVAALIGGTAGSAGPIVGGVLYVFAQDEFGAHGFTQLLTGAAIVVFIVALPRGLVGGVGHEITRRLAATRRAAP